jgi:NADH-quinone oxidoreductase subunit E
MTAGRTCADTASLEAILARYPAGEPSLIPILQDIQRAYAYLPCEALLRVAEALRTPIAHVFSVATFYRAFALTPQGRTVVTVCTGTACHVRGASQILDALQRRLGIPTGETTPDLGFTLKTVNCVGACAMAPLLIVGGRYHGNLKAARLPQILTDGGADEG